MAKFWENRRISYVMKMSCKVIVLYSNFTGYTVTWLIFISLI